MNANSLLERINLDIDDVVSMYVYGSRIYGTNNDKSDWDILIVLNDSIIIDKNYNNCLTLDNNDITLITLQEFKNDLITHSMQRLELLWIPTSFILIDKVTPLSLFTLDLNLLRKSVATISTKCLAYAKILWLKEHDFNKSKKNIFHSIRYVVFGIQIMKNGMITDYTEANKYYYRIFEDTSNDWNHYKKMYGMEAKNLYKQFVSLIQRSKNN